MGPLTDRQMRYLLAAFDAAPDRGVSFDYKAVGTKAGFSESETQDLLSALGKCGLIGPLVYGNDQTLTPEGRELAREIRQHTKRVPLSDNAQRLFLAVADATARGEDCDYAEAAAALSIPDDEAQDIRARLLDAALVEEVTFATLQLTESGESAALQVRAHRAQAEDAEKRKAAEERRGIHHIDPTKPTDPPSPPRVSPPTIPNRVGDTPVDTGSLTAALSPKDHQLLVAVLRAGGTLPRSSFTTPLGYSADEVNSGFLRLAKQGFVNINSKAWWLTPEGQQLAGADNGNAATDSETTQRRNDPPPPIQKESTVGSTLTLGMKAWLVAAYNIAGHDGEGFYSTVAVRQALGMSEAEESDICNTLSRCDPILTEIGSYPMARLTDYGREWARDFASALPLTYPQTTLLSAAYALGPTGKPLAYDAVQEPLENASARPFAGPEGVTLVKSVIAYLSAPPFALFESPDDQHFSITARGRDMAERHKPKGLPPVGWLEKQKAADAASKHQITKGAHSVSDKPATDTSKVCEAVLGKLSPRQQQYFLAAYEAAPDQGDEFHYRQTAHKIGISQPDSHNFRQRLAEVGLILPNRAGSQQVLTPLGRQCGKQLAETQERSRRIVSPNIVNPKPADDPPPPRTVAPSVQQHTTPHSGVVEIIRNLNDQQERFLVAAYQSVDAWNRFRSSALIDAARIDRRNGGAIFKELQQRKLVDGGYDTGVITDLGRAVAQQLLDYASPHSHEVRPAQPTPTRKERRGSILRVWDWIWATTNHQFIGGLCVAAVVTLVTIGYSAWKASRQRSDNSGTGVIRSTAPTTSDANEGP